MVLSLIINGLLGFGFLIGLLFSVTDIEGALNSPTKSPVVEILYQALQSKPATTAVVSLFVVVFVCIEMGMVASTSRLTWAFARDNGLPFSKYFAHVSPIPVEHRVMLTATAYAGEPALQNPASRYPTKCFDCDVAESHQHRIVHGIQCGAFADYDFPLLFLHASYRHHGSAADAQRPAQLRSLYARSIRLGDKCYRTPLGRLYCSIRCFSDRDPGDSCQHELCVISIRKCLTFHLPGLVSLRSKVVSGPYQRAG